MNIHHLELFYYVARHGGISRAVRLIPYGIQQPAVSSQILQLEQGLKTKLFERSPFQLTTEGAQLFAFVRPFFDNLGTVASQLSQRAETQLRIGASELVLRDNLPQVMHRVRERHPCIRMPLVLLVHRDSPIKSAEELWSRRKIDDPLICLPASEGSFQKGLRRRKVEWQQSIEASSLQLVTWYVANGYGVGVNVNVPDVVRHADVRALPLDGFDPVEIVALWQGRPSALTQTVLDEARAYCRENWPTLACNESVDPQSDSDGGSDSRGFRLTPRTESSFLKSSRICTNPALQELMAGGG